MPDHPDAVIVGSGPNGLAAAVRLAQAGLSVTVLEAHDSIGGGTRSAELTVPGVLHDVCSGTHPFGVASPYFASLPLADHGLEWRFPEIDLAHPIDGGRAGVLVRSVDETASGMGQDAAAWRRSFRWLTEHFDELAGEILGPLVHLPRHPLVMARFGLGAALPVPTFLRRFSTDEARGLFAGAAAHLFRPLTGPATASVGIMFAVTAHAVGWPVAAGGSQAITGALASLLTSLGGTIETGVRVTSLDQLPPSRVRVFDTSPTGLLDIAGDALPGRTRRAYRRWRYGPAAFKLDLAVEGGVPWTNEDCRRAGTVHVGGTYEEINRGEVEVQRGRLPDRPFVLVGQQYLCDQQRSSGDVHPIWAYAHVPHAYTGDARDTVLDHVERFAPGLRDRIVGEHVTTPTEFAAYNDNFVGGDIAAGANTLRQIVFRPRISLNPYATGMPGTYLCSAATPPGAGVHGMGGCHAAEAALAALHRRED